MAKISKEDFINSLKEMTILEVKELVDAMEQLKLLLSKLFVKLLV